MLISLLFDVVHEQRDFLNAWVITKNYTGMQGCWLLPFWKSYPTQLLSATSLPLFVELLCVYCSVTIWSTGIFYVDAPLSMLFLLLHFGKQFHLIEISEVKQQRDCAKSSFLLHLHLHLINMEFLIKKLFHRWNIGLWTNFLNVIYLCR